MLTEVLGKRTLIGKVPCEIPHSRLSDCSVVGEIFLRVHIGSQPDVNLVSAYDALC